MPYIKKNQRPKLDEIVKYIGENLDLINEKEFKVEIYKKVINKMIKAKVKANGDLNYLLFALCKRYVKPSYNNYKKYLSQLNCDSYFTSLADDQATTLELILYGYRLEVSDRRNLKAELDCCKREIYRKLVVPYEEEKIIENGEVPGSELL